MALINCPQCGKKVSDKAVKCPHCGYKKFDKDKQTHNENCKNRDTEIDSVELHSKNKPNNSHNYKIGRRYFKPLLLCILSISLIGIIYYWLNSTDNTAEEPQVEYISADIVNPNQAEITQLDSRSHDSVNNINFTTPDLSLFELHGKVKTVSYNSQPTVAYDLFDCNQFDFDEKGILRNKPELFNLMEPDGEDLERWEYNDNGFPIKGVFGENVPSVMYWEWNSNGNLKESFSSFGSHSFSSIYEYTEQGNLLSIKTEEHANMGVEVITNIKVEIIETDELGNWLKRTLTKEIDDGFDCISDDPEPVDGYVINDYEGYKRYERRDTIKEMETRTITYY